MSEFSERKIRYYNKNVSFLDTHCHIILSIFLIISIVRVTVHIFVQKAGMTLGIVAIIAFILLLVVSILSYSLLDKMAYVINVICGCYQILVRVVSSVLAVKVTATAYRAVWSGNGGKMGEFIALGSMIETLIILAVSIAITIYFVFVLRCFCKNKKLFFSSMNELKTEYSEE